MPSDTGNSTCYFVAGQHHFELNIVHVKIKSAMLQAPALMQVDRLLYHDPICAYITWPDCHMKDLAMNLSLQ